MFSYSLAILKQKSKLTFTSISCGINQENLSHWHWKEWPTENMDFFKVMESLQKENTFGFDYDHTVKAELGQEAQLSQKDVGLWCRYTLGSSFDC